MEGGRVEQEKVLVTWKAFSRLYKKREKQFLTIPVVIGVLLGIVLAIAGEWMAIAVIVALIFAYYVWSTVPPEEVEYGITTRGVRVHGRLYMWEAMIRWWITEKWGQRVLMIDTPEGLAFRVVMPLGEMDEEKIEAAMSRYLLHEVPEETGIDKAGKWLSKTFPLETR